MTICDLNRTDFLVHEHFVNDLEQHFSGHCYYLPRSEFLNGGVRKKVLGNSRKKIVMAKKVKFVIFN